MEQKRKILLIEDNEIHATLVRRHLANAKFSRVEVEWVTNLEQGIERITAESFDAVLLDLSLPDSPITDTLNQIVEHFPGLPVIVLTSLNDLEFANRAVQKGAQDYLDKSDLNSETLDRSIRYAIERKRAQRQLQKYADDLEASNRHLQSFAHTLAHEVRSPLTVVSGCLQMIRDQNQSELNDITVELIHDSLTAIAGMTDLVESLLDFSRAGSTVEQFKEVDLMAELSHVRKVLQPNIIESAAEIVYEALPTVSGDPIQIRQLLQNLVANAIKYRREEPLKVTIECETSSSGWQLVVKDNGRGIERDDQARIFEPFMRVEGVRNVAGVGIGLAFCKRIVEAHRGKIWVQSNPGVGSQFFVFIPNPESPDSEN